MPSRDIRDSRRLTGPNVLWDRPGAVLDVSLESSEIANAIAAWEACARALLDGVGWTGETTTHRRFPGGASLAVSAPLDALYAATALNEAAWEAAVTRLDGDDESDEAATVHSLSETIDAERNSALMDLLEGARQHAVTGLSDDDHVSVGLGRGSQTWAVNAIPAIDAVDWDRIHDIPIAMITGTNGKTTTVRLLAAMVEAAGETPGVSSTDWLKVGDETLDLGDWSGPGGARVVLRDQRVDKAILETARGGMLRRGLAVTSADVGAILNVAEDHLGEWGVENMAALVEAKFVLARAARHLVLNADDPEVVARAAHIERPITWFGLDPSAPILSQALESGERVLTVSEDALCGLAGGSSSSYARVEEIPIALGGAARHNVANALAAVAVAEHLGLPPDAIREGLCSFRSDAGENPGRLNRFALGGAKVLVDFAHNPHGLRALLEMAAAIPARRRLVLIGQAGDRTDTSIRDLARIVWAAQPDRIIIKEMRKYLRGREEGEIPRLIAAELAAVGAPGSVVGHAGSELEGVRQALEWSKDGDLLLVLTHESRDDVISLMGELEAAQWRPGTPIPTSS